jgi:DNA-binding transcriptional ArsR family regulator
MLQTKSLSEEALDALGNPERRRLLRMLADGPRSVAELAEGFTISRPAISRHLKVLAGARLVRHETAGTRNLYRLDPQGFAATAEWLDAFWDDAEARIRLLAESLAERPRE